MAASGVAPGGQVRRRPVKLTLGRRHGVAAGGHTVGSGATRAPGLAPGDTGVWDVSTAPHVTHAGGSISAHARDGRPAALAVSRSFTQRPRGGDMDTDMRRGGVSGASGAASGGWAMRARSAKRRQRPVRVEVPPSAVVDPGAVVNPGAVVRGLRAAPPVVREHCARAALHARPVCAPSHPSLPSPRLPAAHVCAEPRVTRVSARPSLRIALPAAAAERRPRTAAAPSQASLVRASGQ